MTYQSKYTRRTRLLSGLLTCSALLFTAIAVGAMGMVFSNLLRSRQDQQAFQELAQMVEEKKPPQNLLISNPDSTEPSTEAPSPYQILKDQNPDFAAWLTVPGTAIDYPVVHTPQDTDRYIYTAFDGSQSPSGTPFVGDHGDLDSPRSIIYGHNMKDGTMFHDLLKYEKESFWVENPKFTIHTLEGERTYDIFAVVRTRVLAEEEQGLRYYRLEDGLEDWLLSRSLYNTGITPTAEDSIVLLSTCSYHTEEGRFVIAGRLRQ